MAYFETQDERSLVHIACDYGAFDVLVMLHSEFGADLNPQFRRKLVGKRFLPEYTPLHYAFYNRHTKISLYMLENGADTRARDTV